MDDQRKVMRRWKGLAGLTLVWLGCGPASAEDAMHAAVGDKLRIHLEQGSIEGVLTAFDEGTLTLKAIDTGREARYPLRTVYDIEVSRPGSRRKNARRGALIGGAVGATGGVIACLASDCAGAWTAIAAGVYGGGGAMAGAIVGAAVRPSDVWRPAVLKGVHPAVVPLAGGLGVVVAVGF